MNKNDIIESLTKVLSTKKEARDAAETIFRKIKNALKEGNKVVVSGFGSFNSVIMKAKRVRNPKTGQIINIPPRKKIRFRQSKDFFS
jgi:DNA-binding protein HU-beta